LKLSALLLLIAVVFVGVATFDLQRRGLLTREALEKYIGSEDKEDARISIAEPIGLAASIQEKQRRLRDEKDDMTDMTQRLEIARKELEEQRAMLERRIETLKAEAEAEAEKTAPEPPASEEPRVASEEMLKLIKMYENMPPEDAAEVLENLDDPMVAQMLLQMRNRQAARIMESMDRIKAAEVSRLLSEGKIPGHTPAPEPTELPEPVEAR
jgi:flagellar motility protein MotE (MotC chaperone)